LVDDVYKYVYNHFFKNEEVDVLNDSGRGCRFAKVLDIIDPNAEKE
jgi:hypothetical protein